MCISAGSSHGSCDYEVLQLARRVLSFIFEASTTINSICLQSLTYKNYKNHKRIKKGTDVIFREWYVLVVLVIFSLEHQELGGEGVLDSFRA